MRKRLSDLFLAASVLVLCSNAMAAERAVSPDQLAYMYRVVFIQAKPAGLAPMLDLLQSDRAKAVWKGQSQIPPMMLRHSQGDSWDLMLLYPIKSYTDYFSAKSEKRRAEADYKAFVMDMDALTVSEEVLFSYGEDWKTLSAAYAKSGFFHVEVFDALPGKKAELFEQRVMENKYAASLSRTQNFIFVGDQGTDGDAFTIGFYSDFQTFAGLGRAETTQEQKRAAAIAAGFDNENTIGTYLRELIYSHQDTLAVKVK